MKFTLSWLKDHLETDATLAGDLSTTSACSPPSASRSRIVVDDKAAMKFTQPFTVIAKVSKRRSSTRTPTGCACCASEVDTGDGKPVQVVCGAPNARAGLIGALARPAPMCRAST
jgi:phenylalanyl-tRNA synthetase beta chain